MAIIPRYDESQVQTTGLPTPRAQGLGPDAFGAGIAQGLGEGAEVAFHVAKQEKAKADSAAVAGRIAEAQNYTIDYLTNPETGLLNKKGKDAIGIETKALQDFDKRSGEILQSLTNKTQQQAFVQHTAEQRNHFMLQVNRHERAETEKYHISEAGAHVDATLKMASLNYQDPKLFNQNVTELKTAAANYSMLNGWGQEQASGFEGEVLSKAYENAIHQLADRDPGRAMEWFNKDKDKLEPAAMQRLEDKLKHVTTGTRALAAAQDLIATHGPDKLLADDKDGTKYHGNVKLAPFDIAGMMEEVRKAHPDDPDLVERIRGNLLEQKSEHDEAAREQRETNTDYVYGILAKKGLKGASEVYASEQYRQMSGKDQEAVHHEVVRQQREIEHEQRERRSEARAARMEHKMAQQDAFENWMGTHEIDDIHSMSKADIQHMTGKIGVANVNRLLAKKKEVDGNEKKLGTAKAEELGVKEAMVEAGMDWAFNSTKSAEEKRTYGKVLSRVTDAIREEGTATGKEITPERKKEIYKEQLLKVHLMKKGFFGDLPYIGGPTSKEGFMFEADPYNVVIEGAQQEDVAMAVSFLSSRGIKHPSMDVIKEAVTRLKQ